MISIESVHTVYETFNIEKFVHRVCGMSGVSRPEMEYLFEFVINTGEGKQYGTKKCMERIK